MTRATRSGTAGRAQTTVALDFLGCKVNQAEIEELGRQFTEAGYALASPAAGADIYILNTCTITHVADRKARLLIHRAARRHPAALIVATGCLASVDPDAAQAIEGVDLVISNADKPRLVEIVRQIMPATVETPVAGPAAPPVSALGRTRALLKVQDGCDRFCTYCIVPTARGRPRSLPIAAVVESVQRYVERGYQEVILTGVCLGSYGRDWPQSHGSPLRDLVEAILRQTNLPRLRLSSIEPENLDPAILELWSDRRFCRHLHLPLQSGCDATLRRMGRRYGAADYARLVEQARAIAPDAALTTDMIVGFPGETDDEFAQSLAFAQAMAFARIHVFRFSPRRGTPATRLPGRVPEAIKKERCAVLIGLSERGGRAFRQHLVGTTREVLWQEPWPGGALNVGVQPGQGWWWGLTDNYIRVYGMSSTDLRNRITAVRLQAMLGDGLLALLDECAAV